MKMTATVKSSFYESGQRRGNLGQVPAGLVCDYYKKDINKIKMFNLIYFT